MSDQMLEASSVEPVWGERVSLGEIQGVLPAPGQGVRTINSQIEYRGSIILVTRYVTADDFCLRGRWELHLVSGEVPVAKRLLVADGHVSLFREVTVRCELNPQTSLLGQEATITIETGTLPVPNPEPIHLLIKG